MTELTFIVLPIVVTSTFAALMGYGGYRYILYKYPMPGDPGFADETETPDNPAQPARKPH